MFVETKSSKNYLTYLLPYYKILSGSRILISANMGHSSLIYHVLINVACKCSYHKFIFTWKNETKPCEDM